MPAAFITLAGNTAVNRDATVLVALLRLTKHPIHDYHPPQ